MLVDGFTVLAQLVNFLILVWLLQRFLYRPVLTAIEAREKKIAAQLADAAAREGQAGHELEDLEQRKRLLDQQRDGMLQAARTEADAERKRLLEAARSEADQTRQRLVKAAEADRVRSDQQLVARIHAEALQATRRILMELAGLSVEERMIEVFVAHLQDLPQERRRQLDTQGATTAIVRTAFELSAGSRPVLESAVREVLPRGAGIDFEVMPRLLGGIELSVNGRKIAWSLADSLAAIAGRLAVALPGQPALGAVEGGVAHGL